MLFFIGSVREHGSGRRPRVACCWLLLAALLSGGAWASGGAWSEALRERDADALQALLEEPAAPVNQALADGTTALMVSAKRGRSSLVRSLVDRGADVRAENTRGGTALMYAAISGDPSTLGVLLDQGARVDHRASNGWTALTIAAAKGRARAVRLLLAAGADPDIPDIYGWTPLMRAVDGGYEDAARVLLEAGGCLVNARDESGATALHHAAADGEPGLVRLLLQHGADPSRRTTGGLTARDMARMRGREEVLAELGRSSGSRPPG